MSPLTAKLKCPHGTGEDTHGAEAVTEVASDEDGETNLRGTLMKCMNLICDSIFRIALTTADPHPPRVLLFLPSVFSFNDSKI